MSQPEVKTEREEQLEEAIFKFIQMVEIANEHSTTFKIIEDCKLFRELKEIIKQ